MNVALRIDLSEGIDPAKTKTNCKELLSANILFLNLGFKFQTFVMVLMI